MGNYLSINDLKNTVEIGDDTYADPDISTAIDGAEQVIEGYKNTRYYPTTETRTYSPQLANWPYGGYGYSPAYELRIDDLNTLTSVHVDNDGDGVYETTWTVGTDFFLEPQNAATDGVPYNKIVLRLQSGRRFPAVQHSVQVTGSFGYASTPERVKQAAKILASRYLKRARETPYGLLTIVGDSVLAARLGKVDPDVATLLDSERGRVPQPWA